MNNSEFKLLKPNMIIYRFYYDKKIFGYVSAIYKNYPNLLGFSRFKDAWIAWEPIDDPKDFYMASASDAMLWKLENAA